MFNHFPKFSQNLFFGGLSSSEKVLGLKVLRNLETFKTSVTTDILVCLAAILNVPANLLPFHYLYLCFGCIKPGIEDSLLFLKT